MERRPVGDGWAGENAGVSVQAWEAYPPNMRQQPEWFDIPESPPQRFTHSQDADPPVARPEYGKRRLSASPEDQAVNPPKRSSSGLGSLPDQVDPADISTLARSGRAVATQEPAGQGFTLQTEPVRDSPAARKAASRKSPREAPKNQPARAETPPKDRGKSLRTRKAENPGTGWVEMWQSEKVNVNRARRTAQAQRHNTGGVPGPSRPPPQGYPYTTALPLFERFICEWPWAIVSCMRDYLTDWDFRELRLWHPSKPQQPGSGAAGMALRYVNNIRGSSRQQALVPSDLMQLVKLPPLDERLHRILAAQDLHQARLDATPRPPQPLTGLTDLVNRMHRLHLHMREQSLAVSEIREPPRLSLSALHSENGEIGVDAAQHRRSERLHRNPEPQQPVSRSGCNEPLEAPDSDDILSTGLSEMSIRGSTTGPVTEPEEGASS